MSVLQTDALASFATTPYLPSYLNSQDRGERSGGEPWRLGFNEPRRLGLNGSQLRDSSCSSSISRRHTVALRRKRPAGDSRRNWLKVFMPVSRPTRLGCYGENPTTTNGGVIVLVDARSPRWTKTLHLGSTGAQTGRERYLRGGMEQFCPIRTTDPENPVTGHDGRAHQSLGTGIPSTATYKVGHKCDECSLLLFFSDFSVKYCSRKL
jgi:hypothetical protein